MIFKGKKIKIFKDGDTTEQYAIFKTILGHEGNLIRIFMQKYQLKRLGSVYGEVFVNGESIGLEYWGD